MSLSTYGALVAAAYLVGIAWLRSQIPFMPRMSEDKFWTLVYGLFFGAVVGGKLLFIALEWRSFWTGELGILRDIRYGFVFFGGFFGAMVAGLVLARKLGLPYLATADYLGVALPMGHWLGRVGCLAAGCCYGQPSALPWAVRLGPDPASSTPPRLWGVPLHPTQLYEALANIAIFLFLLRRALPLAKKGLLPPGTVFTFYLLLYSAARFLNEFYRGDDRGGAWLGLYVSQWIALACAAGALAALARWRPRLGLIVGL